MSRKRTRVVGETPDIEAGTEKSGNALIPIADPLPQDGGVQTSVLIVDDHPSFRRAARRLLEREGFTVTGEAADGSTAIEESLRLAPDLILLDIQLPDMDGFEVTRRLTSYPGSPIIILVSSRDATDYGDKVRRAPARGFIGKADLCAEAITELLQS